MLALTLLQPWSYCICHLDKPVENRGWTPPQALIGQRFCIHAGKTEGTRAREALAQLHQIARDLRSQGRPVLTDFTMERLLAESSAIVCVVTLDRVSRRGSNDPIEESFWRTEDEYGWVLRDVVNIDPVPRKGAQGLWKVPDEIAAVVKQRYEAAEARAA